MGPYVTPMRGHDAEWLLQQELVLNDVLVQKAQEERKFEKRDPETILRLDPVDPGEIDTAVRVFHRVADRARLDEGARTELLTALGLGLADDESTTPSDEGPKPAGRKRGKCSDCGRSSIYLRKDGTLTAHSRTGRTSATEDPCRGGGTYPVKERR